MRWLLVCVVFGAAAGCSTYLVKPETLGTAIPHYVRCDFGGSYPGVALAGPFVYQACIRRWEARGYRRVDEHPKPHYRDDEGEPPPKLVE